MPAPTAPIQITPDLEKKTVALALRDIRFAKETLGNLKPDYFTNVVDQNLYILSQDFVTRYGVIPEIKTLFNQIKTNPKVSASEHATYAARLANLATMDLREREYIRDVVHTFCRNQAYLLLAAQIPTFAAAGQFDKIKEATKKIEQIGEQGSAKFTDYFEGVARRKQMRADIEAGVVKLGVTTGFPEIDMELYRNGFGRGTVTGILGPAKRGKTALAAQMCGYSSMAGSNVFYISLEVGLDIFEDRMDACFSSTDMSDLITSRDSVELEVQARANVQGRGHFYIEVFPTSTFTMAAYEALLESYQARGVSFDLVVIDYPGIMKMPVDDRFLALGMLVKDIRRVSVEYNMATIVPVQGTRNSVGKQTSGMEDIGESFAIAQDVDLLISINADEAEMANGVRRLHWAASRNEAEKTITVQGDLSKMQTIQTVVGVSR